MNARPILSSGGGPAITPSPSSAPHRRLRLWPAGLAIAVLALAYLLCQANVPPALASYMARDLHKMTGARAEVTVEASPFWKLGTGRFDLLDVTLFGVDFGGNRIKEVSLHWEDGGVNLGDLAVGVVHITRIGVMTVRATLSTQDLTSMIPAAYRPYHPTLSVTPQALVVGGSFNLDGLNLPVSLSGRLVPSSDGRAVVFHPTRFTVDGRLLPSPPESTVFSLSKLPLPQGVSLRVTSVDLAHGLVVLDLIGS